MFRVCLLKFRVQNTIIYSTPKIGSKLYSGQTIASIKILAKMSAFSLCFGGMLNGVLSPPSRVFNMTLPTKSSHRGLTVRRFTLPRHLHHVTIILLLIALAGDIKLNPGLINIDNRGRDQFSLYCMNARSISGSEKLSEFNLHFAYTSDVDTICVSETWLIDNVLSSEILDDSQYLIFLKDRVCRVNRLPRSEEVMDERGAVSWWLSTVD